MKYEMIFGDAWLFDGAPDDCFCVAKNVYDNRVFYKEVDRCLFWLDCEKWKPLQFMSCTPLAMRRIIKEPKRWTVEDQKAGRLPEVGAELIHKTKGICYFVGVGLVENACWALKLQSGLIYIAEKSWCSPIETPEEKAQRLRDEWARKASEFIDDELDCVNLVGEHVMRRFYNAMLSGDLPVPVAPEQNK